MNTHFPRTQTAAAALLLLAGPTLAAPPATRTAVVHVQGRAYTVRTRPAAPPNLTVSPYYKNLGRESETSAQWYADNVRIIPQQQAAACPTCTGPHTPGTTQTVLWRPPAPAPSGPGWVSLADFRHYQDATARLSRRFWLQGTAGRVSLALGLLLAAGAGWLLWQRHRKQVEEQHVLDAAWQKLAAERAQLERDRRAADADALRARFARPGPRAE